MCAQVSHWSGMHVEPQLHSDYVCHGFGQLRPILNECGRVMYRRESLYAHNHGGVAVARWSAVQGEDITDAYVNASVIQCFGALAPQSMT